MQERTLEIKLNLKIQSLVHWVELINTTYPIKQIKLHTQGVKSKQLDKMTSTKVKWTSENINHLLHAMKGHRPFGLEKHFHMMFIVEKFRARSKLNVSAEALWDYVEQLYDINLLSEREHEEFKKKPVDYCPPERNSASTRSGGDSS